MDGNQLKRKIMRRVYYLFALRTVSSPIFIQGSVLAVSFFLLTRVVSVPDVWRNLMGVEVGQVFGYLFNALLGTQTITVILLAVFSLTALSIFWRLLSSRRVSIRMDGEQWV